MQLIGYDVPFILNQPLFLLCIFDVFIQCLAKKFPGTGIAKIVNESSLTILRKKGSKLLLTVSLERLNMEPSIGVL